MNSNWKKAAFFGGLAMVLSGMTAGAYAILERFLIDRQSAIERVNRPLRAERIANRPGVPLNAADIERGGRDGRPIQASPSQAAEAGQAAIQRQLRTLEEINKINEMNRRLAEQQQRMQNQTQSQR